jgi:glycosyltransferase involved in cell wall biosynthesis
MTRRRALVCGYYPPEPDRDSGSRRVLDHLEFLRDDGWAVDYIAANGFRDDRYVRGLARRAIAPHDGTATPVEDVVALGCFDLIIFAFWQTAERYLPLIRRVSPHSRVIVDSVDLQLLRDARRTLREPEVGLLSEEYGSNVVGELNVYATSDGVLTVSEKEATLINDLTSDRNLAMTVPDCEDLAASAVLLSERTGIVFVGSFQHAPNASAVEFLCREIVPRLDAKLLERHPVRIVGAGLDETLRAYGSESPHIRMVGWVPSVAPYLERSRISVVPLLYGAGTKRKLIQTLMVGTPAVSTTIGVEGLQLVDGEHVLVADEPAMFAERVTELLTDDALWSRLARAGRNSVDVSHGRAAIRRRFEEAIERALAGRPKPALLAARSDGVYWGRMIYLENQKLLAPMREMLRANVAAGRTIAVLTGGSSELLQLGGWRTRPFPMDEDGGYAGHPESAAAALDRLHQARDAGASHLLVPGSTPWWWTDESFPEFTRLVRTRFTCVAENEACALYALRERAAGIIASEPPLSLGDSGTPPPVRLIAFHLPQFHPIPENDGWWGEGFTEWSNVARARPLYPGHHQPHVPADLGFYDMRLAETRRDQAALAREHGIHGFCHYHYWFHGKRLLERPFNELLASGEPDLPFCLCWANEPWSRRWHGRDEDVLQPQRYSHGDDLAHIRWLLPALSDRRAIRIHDKPVFVVYQARDLPEPARTVETWRREAAKEGVGELYLMTVETGWDEGWDATEVGFDAKIMFRPQFTTLRNTPALKVDGPETLEVHDYAQAWPALAAPEGVAYPHYETVCPSWDNTPRAGERGVVLHGSTPAAYGQWLAEALARAARRPSAERVVFVNAWNEWAEGCHLEPDLLHGRGYLEATREALAACAREVHTGHDAGNGSRPGLGVRRHGSRSA